MVSEGIKHLLVWLYSHTVLNVLAFLGGGRTGCVAAAMHMRAAGPLV